MSRVIHYTKDCQGCFGNLSEKKVQQVCKKYGVTFEEHRTIFWDVWEKEAEEIMKLNAGLKLPFFYETETGAVLQTNSLTPLETIEKWLKNIKETN